ncbi:exonuclease V subunit [Salmonella enterica subsp. enterica]|uniref:Exonuclease V subunit n=1 Tax=Salmonella enterica I TaxID=59201 RepID=A0A379WM06_SALET|nr:exonuclease V subunit [Salmonella enterica subsp. enterica]
MLQAVMAPERENTLRSALATSMMGLTALDIETLNNDENAWMRFLKSLMATDRFGINAA